MQLRTRILTAVWICCLLGAASLSFAQQNPAAGAQPAAASPSEDPPDLDSGTEINVRNADIAAIVRIFSRKTKRNYLLDERVKGKVTIYLPGRVSDDEAVRILDSVLALKGFTAVPISDNLWKILPSKEAKQSTIPTLTDGPSGEPSGAMVTRLLNLKFLGAEDAKNLLSPLVSGDGLLNAYTGTNSLILIDSQDNIERLVRIIESLDVPFSDREMTILPIKYADAVELADKLAEILGIGSNSKDGQNPAANGMDLIRARMRDLAPPPPNAGGPGAPPGSVSGGSAFASTITARAREPKIIPDERTNAIIIVADDDTTARIRALVSQLDSKVDRSGRRFYVYRCRYANAEDLAQALSGAAGGSGGGTSSSSRDANSSTNPFGNGDGTTRTGLGGSSRSGTSGRGLSSSRTQDRLASQQRTPGRSRSGSNSGGATGTVSIGEDITITADPATNSLIIYADKSEYMKLKELLKKLDIRRKQVLVEAMLLEVGVDDSQIMGFDFLASAGGKDGGVMAESNFGGDLTNLFSNPAALSNFSIAAASAGTLTLPGGTKVPTQSVLLTAAKANTNVNVLSAPQILATDNEQAEIVVGQNVPFLASTSTSGDNLNNTFNQIDRQDVGITLRITPQISGEESVRLQLFTEVSNVVDSTATSELGPTTTIRTSETSVITKDGQMVVIGGLMSDSNSDTETGVPFLKDIPVLGQVFRDSSGNRRRTNLLIFITPRIVADQFDFRDTTIEKRDVLENEMEEEDMWPRRKEVLHNPNIDKVAERNSTVSKSMGTILAPDKREVEGNISSGSNNESSEDTHEGVLDLKVAPKLPDFPAANAEEPLKGAALKLEKGDRFVVLKAAALPATGVDLPFELSPKQRLIALHIPVESAGLAGDFFRAGADYQYQINAGNKPALLGFSSQAVVSNIQEARSFFDGDDESFYELSPYELFNLGKGPWLAK
ncbi:MAG: type II secretion system secretin GspD [Oligoflexia bacterium]|nr:type II secretion system secretin GspD [Oligoflexia bacterium]